MANRMERSWLSFMSAIVPKDCTDAQRKALEMAFYAGAASVIGELGTVIKPSTAMPMPLANVLGQIVDACQKYSDSNVVDAQRTLAEAQKTETAAQGLSTNN